MLFVLDVKVKCKILGTAASGTELRKKKRFLTPSEWPSYTPPLREQLLIRHSIQTTIPGGGSLIFRLVEQ